MVSLILIALLLVLSATPGIGPIIGLFFGFGVAFFVGPLAFGLHYLFAQAGVSIALDKPLHLLALFYGLCLLIALSRTGRHFAAGDHDRARSIAAKTALFAALPFAGYLSVNALAKAWP